MEGESYADRGGARRLDADRVVLASRSGIDYFEKKKNFGERDKNDCLVGRAD